MYRKGGFGLPGVEGGRIGFSTLGRMENVEEGEVVGTPRVVDGFLGFSEGGFVHSNESGSSISTVPGARLSWRV